MRGGLNWELPGIARRGDYQQDEEGTDAAHEGGVLGNVFGRSRCAAEGGAVSLVAKGMNERMLGALNGGSCVLASS